MPSLGKACASNRVMGSLANLTAKAGKMNRRTWDWVGFVKSETLKVYGNC